MNLYQRIQLIHRAWRYRLLVDRPEIAFMLDRLYRGQTAIDIGAHKGAYTYWMRKCVGSQGRVFSFEPQPDLARYLRFLTEEWPMPNVTVVEAALSASPGTANLYRSTIDPSNGATLEPSAEQGALMTFDVRLESLDELFPKDSPPVHFIKCDVEGHELEVFQGAEQILRRDRPALLFECEQRHHPTGSIEPVFDFLYELGYEGSFFHGKVLRPMSEFDTEYQRDIRSPKYVYNFAFLPAK